MGLKQIKIGAAVVILQNGKILLGKRLVKAGFGQWGLPGGHIEFGESPVQAAKREIYEETGIRLKKLSFINITNDFRPKNGDHYFHFVFKTEEKVKTPKVMEPDKCEKWEWFKLENLPKPIFFGHKKLLTAVKDKKIFVN